MDNFENQNNQAPSLEEMQKEIRILKRKLALSDANLKRARLISDAQNRSDTILNASLNKELQFFKLILENATNILLLFDFDGRFAYASQTFLTVAGIPNFGLVSGRHFEDVLKTLISEESLNRFSAAVECSTVQTSTVTLEEQIDFNFKGLPRTFSILITTMTGEDGKSTGIMALFNDITEINNALETANRANLAKSDFLANMSHEIRTPMNAIIGITELLLNENLDSRKLKYVKEIYTSSKALLGIINDILDLSKITEGKLEIIPIDSDITVLSKNVTSLMTFPVQAKGLNFIEDIRIKPCEYVQIDETRVNQVLLNLLSNAIKFTNTGYVKFEAEIEGGNILFKVSDTGMGIKQKDQALVFKAFEQADTRKNRMIKGTGLGLSISKNLVEMMGGNIWLESEYGVGTTFYVTIPYVKGSRPEESLQHAGSDSLMAPTACVLIVDDIQANLTVGAGLMRLHGINADIALSGRKAMELIALKDYDIIFMDHMMPEEDGIEVTKKIRKLGGKYEKLPIVALTANALNEAKELLLSSGMDDFLAKPIDRFDLITILKKWLPAEKIEITSGSNESAQAVDYSETLLKTAQIDGMDIESALKRLGGMQDVLEQSIRQTAYSTIDRLHKMDECLAKSDLKLFAIEAHGFKSSLANIGAAEYSILAAELETSADAGDYSQCAEKFIMFNSVMEGFSAELKSVFSETNNQTTKSSDAGNVEFLARKVEEAAEYFESFETDDALACVNELLCFTYGDETDNLLSQAKSAMEAYDRDETIRILRQFSQ